MATNNKYDRQLRLWGADGQAALAQTTVVLWGATAAGCETVKNCILPGVGAVVVVDDQAQVTSEDAAVNFFVTTNNNYTSNPSNNSSSSSHNTPPIRAAVAATLLAELNPDVQVRFVHVAQGWSTVTDWHALSHQSQDIVPPDDGTTNNIIISNVTPQRQLWVASDLTPPVLERLATVAQQSQTPLLIVETYGLIGTLRLQLPPNTVWQPRPRTTRPDLRIARPFPTLLQYFQSFDLNQLQHDSRALGHVPYPVLLWHALQRYGKRPGTFAEKQEFVQTVKDMAGGSTAYHDLLNFQEAVSHAYLAYTEIDVDLDDLLAQAQAAGQTQLVLLLQALVGSSSSSSSDTSTVQLPVHGSLPDMTADTQSYVTLQRIYKAQADADVTALAQRVTQQAQAAGVAPPSAATIAAFCQNLPNIQVWTSRTWADECRVVTNDTTANVPSDVVENLQMAVMEVADDDDQEANAAAQEQLPVWWYLGVRACHLFYQANGRYPGTDGPDASDTINNGDRWEADIPAVQAAWQRLVATYGLTPPTSSSMDFTTRLATEMTRYGAAELHNVAAVLGGVAAQEAVKVMTGQYVPLKNTYVYNGIASVGGVYEF